MGLFHHHIHGTHGQGHAHKHDGGSCSHGAVQVEASGSAKHVSIALLTNMSFALIELIGGYWTHSAAVQADAIHDLGDSAALVGALLLQLVATMPPRAGYHFGFKRLSLLSAVLTSILLVVGSLFIVKEASVRFAAPESVHLNGMFWLALLGVCANGFAAWQMSHGQTQNEKAMTWHMIEDLMGWVAVLFSSVILRFWDLPWLDPALAILIACIVLVGAGRSLWHSLRLFLQAVPKEVNEEGLRSAILAIEGIDSIKTLQIWSLDGERHVCAMTVIVDDNFSVKDWQTVRQKIDHAMESFGRFESTVEPICHGDLPKY